MSVMRTQLSLVFSDKDLYEGLIVPYKSCKELTPLIVRLLSSYYYDETVRMRVDGFEEEAESMEHDAVVEEFNAAAREARKTLAMMDILSGQMTMITEDGLADMASQMNDIAARSGGVAAQETDFGVSVPKFGDLPDTGSVKSNLGTASDVDIPDEAEVDASMFGSLGGAANGEQSASGVSQQAKPVNEAVDMESLENKIDEIVEQRMSTINQTLEGHQNTLLEIANVLKGIQVAMATPPVQQVVREVRYVERQEKEIESANDSNIAQSKAPTREFDVEKVADTDAVPTSFATGDTVLHDISGVPARGFENTDSVNSVDVVNAETSSATESTESKSGIDESENEFVTDKTEATSKSADATVELDESVESEVNSKATEAGVAESSERAGTVEEDEDEEDGADSLQAFLDNGAAFGMEF